MLGAVSCALHRDDELRFGLGEDSSKLPVARPVRPEFVEYIGYSLLQRFRADSGTCRGVNDEKVTAFRQVKGEGRGGGGQLTFANQPLVQAASAPRAQHRRDDTGIVVAGAAEHRSAAGKKDPRQGDIVFDDLA